MVRISTSIAYGACQFGASAMQSIFITYYVILYLDVYKLRAGWFFFGELAFLVWNSINDPLFGYMMRGVSVQQRLAALNGGGALWVLSFAAFFLLPMSWVASSAWLVGLHFLLALLVYDSFLSYVLLVHASLLADLTTDSEQRASCNAWASACSVFGALTVFGANMAWSQLDMGRFRLVCLVVALLSLGSLQVSYYLLDKLCTVQEGVLLATASSGISAGSTNGTQHTSGSGLSLSEFWSHLCLHRNFWLFVVINLVQVFNCHFNSNFLAASLNHLLSPAWDRSRLSALLALAALLPHVVVVLLAPLLLRIGVKRLLQGLSILKFGLSLSAGYILNPESASAMTIAAYFLANKVFTETMCRHGNLVVAELIDEDFASHPLLTKSRSSLYFGAIALFTKPGQALAAMVGWGAFGSSFGNVSAKVFWYATFVPALCGLLQFGFWISYFNTGTSIRKIEDLKTV